ncbi:MAG: hypothetical protein HOP15_15410, partial [Planctomycetes bacterium]|nr:hypothetical protein [Planctomycetota bacterium]
MAVVGEGGSLGEGPRSRIDGPRSVSRATRSTPRATARKTAAIRARPPARGLATGRHESEESWRAVGTDVASHGVILLPEPPRDAGPVTSEPLDPRGEATRLLQALAPGKGGERGPESERLWEVVYDTLRGLAGKMLASERQNHTLQPTALANEAYLRLIAQERVEWQDRAHFLAIAAQAMRRILVDHARGQQRAKRGGDWERIEFQSEVLAAEGESGTARLDLVAVH